MDEKQVVFEDRSSPRKRVKHTFQDLLQIASQAAKIKPPLYINGGLPRVS